MNYIDELKELTRLASNKSNYLKSSAIAKEMPFLMKVAPMVEKLAPPVALASAGKTGWDIGRILGQTPLITDPNTTYDQFYQDMFQKMIQPYVNLELQKPTTLGFPSQTSSMPQEQILPQQQMPYPYGTQAQPQEGMNLGFPPIDEALKQLLTPRIKAEEVPKEGGGISPFGDRTGISDFDTHFDNTIVANGMTRKEYYEKIKGVTGSVVNISPDEYLERAASGQWEQMRPNQKTDWKNYDEFKTYVTEKQRISEDKIKALSNKLEKGEKWNIPSLEYDKDTGKFRSQEGYHRAILAKRMGLKEIPVMLINELSPKEGGGIDNLPKIETLWQPNNKTDAPYEEKFVEGKRYIDSIGDDPYIYETQYVDPKSLLDTLNMEGVSYQGVVDMPTTQKYIEWYKQGKMPPPIGIVKGWDSGDLISTNRRRIIAAIEAGVDKIPAYIEIGRKSKLSPKESGGMLENEGRKIKFNKDLESR